MHIFYIILLAYTSKYTVSLWYGYKDVTEGYNTGNEAKESLMGYIMKLIPKDTKGFKKPSTVVAAQVEVGTWPAQKPSENTPSNLIATEYFVRGTEPSEVSTRFQALNDVTGLTDNKVGLNHILSWNYDTPEIFTEEYNKKYYSQSVFGKGTTKFTDTITKSFKLPDVLVSGSKKTLFTYGEIGFGIYRKDSSGELTLIGYTKDKTYTLTPDQINSYGSTIIVVKAENESYKTNASAGTSIEIKYNQVVPKNLTIILNDPVVTTTVGNYQETGFKSAYYDTLDVLNTMTVKYQLTVNTELNTYTSKEDLVNAVNALPSGTYKITYIATYETAEATTSKTVTLS